NNMLCTQCEPEGFRKITWYPDRPDCLSLFKVKIETSAKFNTILSNGNLIEEGVVQGSEEKRYFKTWLDPFPKPTYLFALVVGNLEFVESNYITLSKKNIILRIYTEVGNKHLTTHAMESLKKAMYWDETNYGLEYDLDIFMIVAVSHFNMGAMENKGLNIFNSKYVLADNNTATDKDLKNVEAIVAHEYFHNWTGNRVTCQDWFQLTLKEGLTVFRDQEFSADMNERGVKRIEDVSLLRSIQFPEDSGSNSHPIRPNFYKEINNFYTPTIYEKGAEFIRMLFNYIGEKSYRKGIDTYFYLYDGKAVTCENFIDALSKGAEIDLSIFSKWYSQAGTPNIEIKRERKNSKFLLNISQKINNEYSNLPIPIKMAFLDQGGHLVDFKINNSILDKEHVYLLCNSKETIIIECEEEKITPSFLRSFSAPVYLKTDLQEIDYLHILKYDNDAFNKWDAAQNLYSEYFIKNKDVTKLTDLLKSLISSNSINHSLMSLLIELPSRASLENLLDTVDPIDVFYKRQSLMKEIALNLKTTLENVALHLAVDEIFLIKNQGHRSLLGKILNYLVFIGSQIGIDLAKRFAISKNMTLSIAALRSLCFSDSKLVMPYLEKFYSNWKNNDLVLEKWFEIMSSMNIEGEGLSFVKKLLKHKDFDNKNPNKLRSVLGTFQKENIILFHSKDMSGYKFIAEQISQIDKYNPQVASRLILPMTQFRSFKK
ncbi:aminopeptidase N, partial [Alphaproteobacteria bacterium]|nr:aminopeptidase N [Alphaproteobacteria bacterium]